MKTKLTLLWTVLFWGSMWGILEASIGWVLHVFQLHHGISTILYTNLSMKPRFNQFSLVFFRKTSFLCKTQPFHI